MAHRFYFETESVGCICAGLMSGNVMEAKERERRLRNREKRKKYFPYRKWKEDYDGSLYVIYKGKRVAIYKNGNYYSCNCNGEWVYRYKGKGINSFKAAALAAFDVVDPFSEAWK